MMESPIGFLRQRTDDKGGFDELLGRADVHFEMMDDGVLWVGLDEPGGEGLVHVWIRATKRGKLTVSVYDESPSSSVE